MTFRAVCLRGNGPVLYTLLIKQQLDVQRPLGEGMNVGKADLPPPAQQLKEQVNTYRDIKAP